MTGDTSFTYTIYIEATPERIWRGLTDPSDTRRYWRHATLGGKSFPSDWTKGSTWDLVHEDVGLVVHDPEQVVLEADPPRRLAYTWHSFTPEWSALVGLAEETAEAWRAEPRSTVTFDIDQLDLGVVRLRVHHDGFRAGSGVLPGISDGWPAVLSSLKTLVETGAPLPSTSGRQDSGVTPKRSV
jgi:uncharacterized protein YndB with AHSA1/START domain